MKINANDVFDLLRVYAEDYGNIKYLYEVYDELSANAFNKSIATRIDSLHRKEIECMRKYFDLRNICDLQADEEYEINCLISAENEYQKERAIEFFNKDKEEK